MAVLGFFEGKNSRASHSKVKQGLFKKETHSRTECVPSGEAREEAGYRVVRFYRGR